jgi:hypothetical protein
MTDTSASDHHELGTELAAAVGALLRFIGEGALTETFAGLEHALEGRTSQEVEPLLEQAGISPELLHAAMLARTRFGRINDVIHATAIALTLPELLEPGEKLRRPSLAAGNDPTRRYDIETDRRVAEFKLARWDGHDAMRKRQLFKDLVQLADAPPDLSAQLYVLGERPLRFLRSTTSTASWALDRSPAARVLFERDFGDLGTPIPDFLQGHGARVKIVDLQVAFPQLFPLPAGTR